MIVGTYVVYPSYRAPAPNTAANLSSYPRLLLLADPDLAVWHSFGMEWKEHSAWLAPILVTAAAAVSTRHKSSLAQDQQLRHALMITITLAFLAAGVAGLFGALITKAAPVL